MQKKSGGKNQTEKKSGEKNQAGKKSSHQEKNQGQIQSDVRQDLRKLPVCFYSFPM